jgi:hypothetical protein
MDTVTSIHEELRTAPPVERNWLKLPDSVVYSSLSLSKLYELISEGKIRSVCLRDKEKARGIRLISRPSLDAYMSEHEKTKGKPVPGRKGRKSKKEKEAELVGV